MMLHVLAGDAASSRKSSLVTRNTVLEQQNSFIFLVAEHHAVNQRLISWLLEKRGHSLVVAQNKREVLQALEKRSFDVVLMDGQNARDGWI